MPAFLTIILGLYQRGSKEFARLGMEVSHATSNGDSSDFSVAWFESLSLHSVDVG